MLAFFGCKKILNIVQLVLKKRGMTNRKKGGRHDEYMEQLMREFNIL